MTVTEAPPPWRPAAPDSHPPDRAAREATSRLSGTFAILRQRAGRVALTVVAGAALGVGLSLILPPEYTADASFFPAQQEGGGSSLAGALGGLSMLMGSLSGVMSGTSQPAPFFMDLLKSSSFYDSLATSTIVIDSTGRRAKVEDFLVKKAKTPAIRRDKARTAIKGALHVEMSPAGIVLVRFKAETPQAASELANRAIVIIDQQNIDFRRREAAQRRVFTEEFLTNVHARLDSAEARLEAFGLANRTYATSPVLRERYTQLDNELERLRGLEQSIEGTVENDRLTEYNNAAVVTRVDFAAVPTFRTGPKRKLITAGFALLVAMGWFWWAYFRAGRPRP